MGFEIFDFGFWFRDLKFRSLYFGICVFVSYSPATGKSHYEKGSQHRACKDPGNAVYGRILRRLISVVKVRDQHRGWQVANIAGLGDEKMGDCIECALAAADMAAAARDGVLRQWPDLKGGAHVEGDRVTIWLVRAVNFACKPQ